jgi:hypothetical protein
MQLGGPRARAQRCRAKELCLGGFGSVYRGGFAEVAVVPKNFVFGPSWRCADRRCQIRLTGGEWQNAVPSIERMLKDTRSKMICELEKSVALKAGNSGPIEYIYTHVACS